MWTMVIVTQVFKFTTSFPLAYVMYEFCQSKFLVDIRDKYGSQCSSYIAGKSRALFWALLVGGTKALGKSHWGVTSQST